MALVLNSTLSEAQDSMERTPLVKMLATQNPESMPFDGQYFNNYDPREHNTTLITLSDGRLFGAYNEYKAFNEDWITFVWTDTARTFWSTAKIELAGIQPESICVVELLNNNIGVIFVQDKRYAHAGATNSLYYMVVTPLGVQVIAPTIIETWAISGEHPNGVSVILLDDDTYFMSYCLDLMEEDPDPLYELHTRTSSNFTTWSDESIESLSPLLTTRDINNTSLVQPSTTEILLFFDYVDYSKDDGDTVVRNIYFILSDDYGLTWAAPVKITNYTEWGTTGSNPYAAERTNGDLALAFTDEQSVLFANEDSLLWENPCTEFNNTNASNIHFNPVTERLYVCQIYAYVGTKSICGVVVIDTTTWEVIGNYNTQSSPDYHDIFKDSHVWIGKDHGEGEFICFSTYSSSKHLCIIDDSIESVTQYHFNDNVEYEIDCNVDISWPQHEYMSMEDSAFIRATWVDSISRRVYVVFAYSYVYWRGFLLGYIELDDIVDPATGKYLFHTLNSTANIFSEAQVMGMKGMLVIPELNLIALTGNSALPTHSQYPGKLILVDLNSGAIVKTFTTVSHNSFPHGGLNWVTYYDGYIFGSFDYTTVDDQENHRGMCKIHIDSEIITYHEPTWATMDDYGLRQKVPTGDGRILVAVQWGPGGVAEFNIASGSWKMHSGETIQGFEPSGEDTSVVSVAYDASNDQIMCGSIDPITTSAFTGVRMFNEIGSYEKGTLIPAIKSVTWQWGNEEEITIEHSETDSAIAIAPDNILWTIWVRKDAEEYSIKWDRDIKEKMLADHLVAGRSVSVKWSVESTGTLSFSVSHGHLFDPNNLMSTWNNFLKKGKIIELSFGELIEGVPYWQTQGKFIIDTIRLEYIRGQYPVMSVTCVSPDFIWGEVHVEASERYDTNDPEDMATNLLIDLTGMSSEEINMPLFPISHEIHHQWIDTNFQSIIMEILDHFQCIPYFDMDGKFSPKVISIDGDVDHTYTGAELIKFTPDDNYSSYTNRVTVTGEGLYFLEVTYPEELIDAIMGTGGWWESEEKIIRVNYSNDLDLVCYDPRMVVITSIKDFKILWSRSGGDEWISAVDTENRWLEITVKFPGIMDVLIFMIGFMILVGYKAMGCKVNCGWWIYLLSLVSSVCSWILGQVATYEYEIYAKPTGEEKQIVSSYVDDLDFQRELGGLVVNEEFEDPFCYTTQSCNEVATHEMNIVRAQRSRVHFEKLAHLQDEICDRIQIKHPYAGTPIDVYITDLERSYTRPKKGAPGMGAFIDKITGWRL